MDGRMVMVTHLVEKSPLLRAKPMMRDTSLAALSDEKLNQSMLRDGSLQGVLHSDDEMNMTRTGLTFERYFCLPETKGRDYHEKSDDKLVDRRSSLRGSGEQNSVDRPIVIDTEEGAKLASRHDLH